MVVNDETKSEHPTCYTGIRFIYLLDKVAYPHQVLAPSHCFYVDYSLLSVAAVALSERSSETSVAPTLQPSVAPKITLLTPLEWNAKRRIEIKASGRTNILIPRV